MARLIFLILGLIGAKVSLGFALQVKHDVGKVHKVDTVLQIRMAPGQVMKFEEMDKGRDWSLSIATAAVVVSIVAFVYPIILGKAAERRSNFFKFYEYWNTDQMLRNRSHFWEIVLEYRERGIKVPLKELKRTRPNDYHNYETVMDTLTDMTKLYNSGLVDRRLVKSVMATFIKSYGDALEHDIDFCQASDSSQIKITGKHYEPLKLLAKTFTEQDPDLAVAPEAAGTSAPVVTDNTGGQGGTIDLRE